MILQHLHLYLLKVQNIYYDGAGNHEPGIFRYKTERASTFLNPEPAGSFRQGYSPRTNVYRRFREHALRKMVGLYPCSEHERNHLWEVWKNR